MKNMTGRAEPVFNLPPVVQALSLINIAVFLFAFLFPALLDDESLYALAFVPARYSGLQTPGFSAIFSPFTHMFLHAGWLHLSINVGMMVAFGAGLERRIGGKRLLLFYFAAGLCGALLHALVYPGSEAPMIGASGAISGLFGGVLMMLHSRGGATDYKKLLPFAAVWIGISVLFGFTGMPGIDNPIAWTAHIGGFIGGLALYRIGRPGF